MNKALILASSILLAFTASSALADRADERQNPNPATFADLGAPASDAVGMEILGSIEAKWSKVMQGLGWTADSFQQFREGYRNYPEVVLREALAAGTFELMQSVFDSHATLRARDSMAKAYPARKAYNLDATTPDVSEQVLQAKQAAAKSLGENAKDLVFIPATPCTIWDTRFSSLPYGTAITPAATRNFFSHWSGGGGNFSPYGGNASCTEANETFIGGRPFAIMMIVYVNNPAGNGWLTFYRAGDPDPSSGTISVYYSPGPTRTQTVVSKSARGYVGGAIYDLAVTGQFSTAHASASVVGYFIKPGATALQCTMVQGAVTTVPANSAATNSSPGVCPAGYGEVATYCVTQGFGTRLAGYNDNDTFNGACNWSNSTASAISVQTNIRCCRVPGR